jgi:DNA polymerase-3 subunit epsilon
LGQEGAILSVWRSRAQAKQVLQDIAAAHRLCLRRLGIERPSRKRGCSSLEVGKCGGACVGKELPALHNARLALAFATRRVKPWPYPGPVLIEERPFRGAPGELFVVDRWRLLRALRVTEEGAVPLFSPAQAFDFELYRILEKALAQPGRRIQPLTAEADAQLSLHAAD